MIINICLSSDDKYAPHLAVTIKSILHNASANDSIAIFILDAGISSENKYKLGHISSRNLKFIRYYHVDCAEYDRYIIQNTHISAAMFAKYKIAHILKDINKVIYLDCDLIVNSSLSELFETNIDNYHIAGVEDVGYVYHRLFNDKLIYKNQYINTGVMLINLDVWRKYDICNKLFNYTIEHTDKIQICFDQDVINAVLYDKCKQLDYKWNVQDSFYRYNDEMKINSNVMKIILSSVKPAIIHFTGPAKPWNKYNLNSKSHLYYKYIKLTPFKSTFKPSLKNRIKQLLKRIITNIDCVRSYVNYWLNDIFYEVYISKILQ